MTVEAKPTGTKRWSVLLLISLMYLVTYLDRANISTAAPVIAKEFNIGKIELGFIFSAFVWSYALFQIPGGWLGDRFGPRRILTGIVGYWSVMTALTAAASGVASFTAVRFLFGMGEAGAFPVATRAMQLWFPPRERGLVQGVSHSASRLGAALSPPVVVAIIATLGWRWVFYICASIGVLWSALWYLTYRDMPEDQASVSRAELAYIRGIDEQGNVRPPKIERMAFLPWGVLWRSSSMWALMCAYFTSGYCGFIFMSWMPSYLVEYRHFTLLKVGIFASLPFWAGVAGDTVGGLAVDWLLVRTGSVKLAHRSVAITGLLGCGACIVPAALVGNAYTAVGCLTAAFFFLECAIAPAWAVAMHIGGQYSGTVSAAMNMAGGLGGGLSPIAFGILVYYGSWQAPFIIAAVLLVFGAGVWAFWLNPEVSAIETKAGGTESPPAPATPGAFGITRPISR
ncbi:MAG TPA: MFS transporter [Acetobacteraceae bacterium]|nr:MFS transporter [Acetobacteraceae bacterium]